MARVLPASFFALLGLGLAAACGGEEPAGSGAPDTDASSSGFASSSGGSSSSGDGASSGQKPPALDVDPCLAAEGEDAGESASAWVDDPEAPLGGNPPQGALQATVTAQGAGCARTFSLASTAELRDGVPANPRQLREIETRPSVQTKSPLFDALYQLALIEAEENQVEAITDWGFNDGNPVACGAAGCFETGRNWKYVWTRDTAYAVDLGLGWVDPARAAASLDFKLSERRAGGGLEIVQDTGTGGSYPVSTDRVVWALGAERILLHGAESLRVRAQDALRHTLGRDGAVVRDPRDGLYRGEQSFLDWRSQSYPAWTVPNLTHIAASKSLSTNVAHLNALRMLASLDTSAGRDEAGALLQQAEELRAAIHAKFWLPEEKQYSTFVTTDLDPAPARQYDLLGTSLAILADVGSVAEAREALSHYPTLPKGPPVLFPEQQFVPIYHNRAIWPFVTAYWMRAAKKVGHDTAYEAAARSLVRGAALNLSNMENLEVVTGTAWLEDGDADGPVVNSQRQLWSVAGYIGMVNENLFGLHPVVGGLEIAPYVTAGIHRDLFGGASKVTLNRIPWHGKTVSVVLRFPATPAEGGAYTITSITHNGVDANARIPEENLSAENLVEIQLGAPTEAPQPLRVIDDVTDYRVLYAPRTPTVTLGLDGSQVRVGIDPAGESGVTYFVYRDGERVAQALTQPTWTDAAASATGASHCYTVESRFTSSGNVSQRALPVCWKGNGDARITTLPAETFSNVGGSLVEDHGKKFYQGWGDRGHSLTRTFTSTYGGDYLFSAIYGNGGGPLDTGIACGLKRLVVERVDTGEVVGSGMLVMPQRGKDNWASWGESTFVRVTLDAARAYRIRIVDDETSVNMTDFRHFDLYTAGTGGKTGSFFRVNIGELKVFALGE